MKRLLLLSLIGLLLACTNEKAQIKSSVYREYSVKTELGELVKGDLIESYGMGYYSNGSQSYFIGMEGYSNKDTVKHELRKMNSPKKEGNKTFWYDDKEELKWVDVEKGDTLYGYFADDLEKPAFITVRDNQGRVVAEGDKYEWRTLRNRKYDKEDNIIYSEVEVQSLLKKKYGLDGDKETKIIEQEFTYYE